MSVMGEFTINSADFALHETLSAVPEMVVEIERLVATTEDRLMPYFWVTGDDHASFEEAFEMDPSLTSSTP
ncbi:bacterio-opsin activator HTH domain-containing protein [Natrialba chahannaoensis JCM 10990]|uniref:Bacterio-opsin activator HTH domain-containing protein n=1 Tax=Natrialba chahannaoensis JCM 10990 TaxID=1227492 RepID=M0AHE7_9EURY|nr:bacterio-opsin activator HTH domain-containing protein [Natrialba chahannaoensis JCM 10990]